MILKTYKYRLYPSKGQGRLLDQTVETCRRWYNTCLAERKTAWETEKRSISKFEQLAKVKDYRKENTYAGQVHSHILQVVVADLDKAFQAFFRRVQAGETPGHPRFKGKNRFDSFGLKEYGNGFKVDGRRLKISGIGRVRVREHSPEAKCRHRPIEGKIKTVRIRRQAGEWYACFACEVTEHHLPPTGNVVGIDVGIHHLLATSENEVVENPRWYRTEQQKLRVIQRRVSRRKKRREQPAQSRAGITAPALPHCQQPQRLHRQKVHHFITNYDVIALEDLRIKGMVRNHPLSKSILDAGWGYLKTHFTGKAVDAGREVILVDPAYTSKTCCSCGTVFHELSLADRWVNCTCGLSMDRDVNAALNILKRAGRALWDESTATRLRLSQEAPPL